MNMIGRFKDPKHETHERYKTIQFFDAAFDQIIELFFQTKTQKIIGTFDATQNFLAFRSWLLLLVLDYWKNRL